MSDARFKTMRHIETVRNYLNGAIRDLMERSENHDQSKLKYPEVEIFEKYTPKLRDCTYGSEQYKKYMTEMNVALDHHYAVNSHHPEFYADGIDGMTLFDLIEMLIDWKAASLRHNDGDIWKSIEKNQERYGYSDEMKQLLRRTMSYIDVFFNVEHNAHES